MRRVVALVATLLITAALVPATGVVGADAENTDSAYAGTHVAFDASTDAVTNYSLGGTTVLESVRVDAGGSGDADTEVGVGASASTSAATGVVGSAVSLSATAETRATVTTESGATLTAHDTANGNLVVTGEGSQVLRANVSEGAAVSEEGDARVVVENGDTTGVFIAVGNASVARTDDGDVSARVDGDGRVVFRAYGEGDERNQSDREAERLVSDGTATAEVYVTNDGGDSAAEVVRYDDNTTVELRERADGNVTVAVERSVEEGAVVLTSVSERLVSAGESLSVTVDGEAAAEVDAASELRTAADGDDGAAYMVADGSADADADAAADVYVALDHFSERSVTMQSDDGSTATETDRTETETRTESADGETATEGTESDSTAATTEDAALDAESEPATTTGSEMPGFGATAALVAVVGGALVAARRR